MKHDTSLGVPVPFPLSLTPTLILSLSLGIFSHNVVPVRAPASFGTGARPYYLFHIGNGNSSGTGNGAGPPTYPWGPRSVINCSAQSTPAQDQSDLLRDGGRDRHGFWWDAPPSALGNLAHRAPTPNGPWEPIPSMYLLRCIVLYRPVSRLDCLTEVFTGAGFRPATTLHLYGIQMAPCSWAATQHKARSRCSHRGTEVSPGSLLARSRCPCRGRTVVRHYRTSESLSLCLCLCLSCSLSHSLSLCLCLSRALSRSLSLTP